MTALKIGINFYRNDFLCNDWHSR